MEKLLSGTGAKMTVIVFTEETWWPSSNTLSECYNNMDVGVPSVRIDGPRGGG